MPKLDWLTRSDDEKTAARLLVVEYKGKDYASNDDSREKKMLGEVWAKAATAGPCS